MARTPDRHLTTVPVAAPPKPVKGAPARPGSVRTPIGGRVDAARNSVKTQAIAMPGLAPFARVAGQVSGSRFGGAFRVEPRVQTGDAQHASDLPRDGHELQPTFGLLVAAGGSAEHVQTGRSQEPDTGAVHTDVAVSGGQEIGQQLLEARCGEAVQLTGEQNTSTGDIADHSQHKAVGRSRLPAVRFRLWSAHAPIPSPKARRRNGTQPRPPKEMFLTRALKA
jgi:hypothetical protein